MGQQCTGPRHDSSSSSSSSSSNQPRGVVPHSPPVLDPSQLARGLTPVYLHIYDLLVLNYSTERYGLGVYHTGVQVYEEEYCFSGHHQLTSDRTELTGLRSFTPPTDTTFIDDAIYKETRVVGYTKVKKEQVREIFLSLQTQFTGGSYNALKHNCHHFSSAFIESLLGLKKGEGMELLPEYAVRVVKIANHVRSCLPPILTHDLRETMQPSVRPRNHNNSSSSTSASAVASASQSAVVSEQMRTRKIDGYFGEGQKAEGLTVQQRNGWSESASVIFAAQNDQTKVPNFSAAPVSKTTATSTASPVVQPSLTPHSSSTTRAAASTASASSPIPAETSDENTTAVASPMVNTSARAAAITRTAATASSPNEPSSSATPADTLVTPPPSFLTPPPPEKSFADLLTSMIRPARSSLPKPDPNQPQQNVFAPAFAQSQTQTQAQQQSPSASFETGSFETVRTPLRAALYTGSPDASDEDEQDEREAAMRRSMRLNGASVPPTPTPPLTTPRSIRKNSSVNSSPNSTSMQAKKSVTFVPSTKESLPRTPLPSPPAPMWYSSPNPSPQPNPLGTYIPLEAPSRSNHNTLDSDHVSPVVMAGSVRRLGTSTDTSRTTSAIPSRSHSPTRQRTPDHHYAGDGTHGRGGNSIDASGGSMMLHNGASYSYTAGSTRSSRSNSRRGSGIVDPNQLTSYNLGPNITSSHRLSATTGALVLPNVGSNSATSSPSLRSRQSRANRHSAGSGLPTTQQQHSPQAQLQGFESAEVRARAAADLKAQREALSQQKKALIQQQYAQTLPHHHHHHHHHHQITTSMASDPSTKFVPVRSGTGLPVQQVQRY